MAYVYGIVKVKGVPTAATLEFYVGTTLTYTVQSNSSGQFSKTVATGPTYNMKINQEEADPPTWEVNLPVESGTFNGPREAPEEPRAEDASLPEKAFLYDRKDVSGDEYPIDKKGDYEVLHISGKLGKKRAKGLIIIPQGATTAEPDIDITPMSVEAAPKKKAPAAKKDAPAAKKKAPAAKKAK